MEELKQRLDKLWTTIHNLHDRSRLDMKKMYKNCENLYDQLSNESVVCRRRGYNSVKFYRIKEALETNLSNAERHLIFACLIS